jgi:hypothetical protein
MSAGSIYECWLMRGQLRRHEKLQSAILIEMNVLSIK